MKTSKFVPVWQIAEDTGIPSQYFYRWIREGKIGKDDYKIEEVSVKKLRIKKDLQIPKYTPRIK